LTSVLDIKICDFGNALLIPEQQMVVQKGQQLRPTVVPNNPLYDDSQILKDGAGRGTSAYTAPELFSLNQRPYSFPVDIYSFGVLLFTLVSQKEPFTNYSSPIHLMLAVQRGFFESENQPLIMRWKNPDPAEGQWEYPSREMMPRKYVELVRPTASNICQKLRDYDT
jgi:serine/threonine protein kinase